MTISIPTWALWFLALLATCGIVYWQAPKVLEWLLGLIATDVKKETWVSVVNNQPENED